MPDPYQITFNSWNKVATLYQERFMHLELYNDSYDFFCEQLKKPNAQVLEIGCGPGNITRYLLSKRPDYTITGIDVAPNMVMLAQHNNPAAHFQIMDCRQLDLISKNFDGIVCGFCVPYLSLEDCKKLIKDCADLITPGGYLYLSAMEGQYEDSGYATGSSGDSMFIYYYEEDRLSKLLVEHHFSIKACFYKTLDFPESKIPRQFIFVAEKV